MLLEVCLQARCSHQKSHIWLASQLFPTPVLMYHSECCLFFFLFCVDTLCAVLQRDTLSIRENRLFGAVVRWAEAECYRQQLPPTSENKQKVLGKALPLIRFPLMTVEEFAAGMCCFFCSTVFTCSDFLSLLKHVDAQLKPQKPA